MKIRISLLIVFLTCVSAHSQIKTGSKDSLKIYKSDGITVTANRNEMLLKNSPSDIEVISGKELSNHSGVKLSDKLSGISGLILKDYGFNGMKTLSLRGMGAEHTLVLYNGEKLNSYQNGNFDLNNFIAEDIEQIEILKSGASALYGSEAIAGVINIIPRSSFRDFGLNSSYSIGSYNYNRIYLNIEKRLFNLMFHTSVSSERSGNNFDYEFSDNGDIYKGKRGNSDFSNKQILFRVNSDPSGNSTFSFMNKYFLSEKGSPDVVFATVSKARQKDEEFISSFNFKSRFSNNLILSITPNFYYSKQRYIDPKFDLPGKIYESKSKNNIFGFSSQFQYLYSDNISTSTGIEYHNITVGSNNYSETKIRNQYSLFLLSDIKAPFSIPLFIYPAIRYDNFSDFGGHLSPKIGLNIQILEKELLFRSSYSENFRAPTFNELYWNPGGNPDLKPEEAKSFDLGLEYSFRYFGNNSVNLNYFDIKVKERIIWLPLTGIIWEPKNIQDAHSKGFELRISSRQFNNKLSCNLSYNYIIARNETKGDNNYNHELPYIPNHTFKASADLDLSNFGAGMNFDLTGDRYSVESNEKNSILPYYDNSNAYIFYNIPINNFVVNIKMEANNLFNSKYTVLPYLPTALRNFKLILSIQY